MLTGKKTFEAARVLGRTSSKGGLIKCEDVNLIIDGIREFDNGMELRYWQERTKARSRVKILAGMLDGGKPWNELVKETGLSKNTLYNHLPVFEDRGVVKRELLARSGRKYKILYVLTETVDKGKVEEALELSKEIEKLEGKLVHVIASLMAAHAGAA